MAEQFVTPIESHCVGPQKPFHAGHQIGARGLDHQMKVIAHQAPGVDLPVGLPTGLAEGLKKKLAVFGGAEDGFAMVATVHDVIDGTRILNSEFSRHDQQVRGKGALPSRALLTILRTDPLTQSLPGFELRKRPSS